MITELAPPRAGLFTKKNGHSLKLCGSVVPLQLKHDRRNQIYVIGIHPVSTKGDKERA